MVNHNQQDISQDLLIEEIEAFGQDEGPLGYRVKTKKDEIELILHGEISCCEKIEATSYPLDLAQYEGEELLGWKVLQQDKLKDKVEGDEDFLPLKVLKKLGLNWAHNDDRGAAYQDWIILKLTTSTKKVIKEVVYLAVSNTHNGYYSHKVNVNHKTPVLTTYI